jgi:hypothetical protein
VGDWKCSYNAGSAQAAELKEIFLGDYLVTTIEKKFQENGIDTRAIRLNQVQIDQDQIINDIKVFGAAAVMEVYLTGAVVTPNRYVLHGVFDFSVREAADNTIYWRAKITADGGKSYVFYPVAIDQSKVIDGLISALQSDGLTKLSPPISN